jgi:hypothetical protein
MPDVRDECLAIELIYDAAMNAWTGSLNDAEMVRYLKDQFAEHELPWTKNDEINASLAWEELLESIK